VRDLTESAVRSDGGAISFERDAGDTVGSREIDRSLGAVMREIARSLAGWLFFVVAIQLLLHGSHLIRG